MGYLTRLELIQLLKNRWFTETMSSHVHQYACYRGRINATVLTLRYNIHLPNFDEDSMIESVIRETMNQFSSQRQILGLIEYDLLLMNPEPESYYIWKANSNVARNLPNSEETIALNYDDLFLFIRNESRINPSDLDVYFSSSNVVINKIIAVVFTFISY